VIVRGLAVGLAVSIGWILLSPAGVAGLLDSFGGRAGGLGQDLPLPAALKNNWTYLTDLWSPVVLVGGLFAARLAWRDGHVRRLLVVAVIGVVGYAAIFWEAAGFHDYWNSWAVVIVAVAFGAAANYLMARNEDADPPHASRNAALLVGVALLALAWAPFDRADTQARMEEGIDLGRVVADTRLPADQPGWLLSALSGSETWISYASDRPVRRVATRATLLRLERSHPDWLMVVPCNLDGEDRCPALAVGGAVVNGVAVNRLSTIVRDLPAR
jgi:hypothetical protein